MASVNKVILVGNLGRDPELKYTPGGTPICTFSLATTERFKDKDGNPQERTEWHNIKIWRKSAEIAAEYLKKGSQVYIEGRIETHSWEKDGEKRYMTEIVVDRFQMLGSRPEGAESARGGQARSAARKPAPKPVEKEAEAAEEEEPPVDEMKEEGDIPF